MIIGLTGQIGGGKSTAASILKSCGAAIVDADLIGRQVVNRSDVLRRKLARRFGKDIIDSNGMLNRKKLATRAFQTEQTKTALNQLVHPYLLKELRLRVQSLQKTHNVVVIDAALLLNWDMDDEVDFVLVIHAALEDRLRRLVIRGMARTDAEARQHAQLSLREYKERSDRVILNNGSLAVLRKKMLRFWNQLDT
ncbi:MAG: dephospho-CoA kinase [candidate division Zixibacteria bacterium]|nr:dephospho-CoA kinase [candidate division Zixibacteria bacterium]